MRKWRGEVDVPLSKAGHIQSEVCGKWLESNGGLDICYHDWLSRTVDTAKAICPITSITKEGARPWRMGKGFEGRPITPQSIVWAEWLVRHPTMILNPDQEPWQRWYDEWMGWLHKLPLNSGKIGVVTHNRNIQAAVATVRGEFEEWLYNKEGPWFCEVFQFDGLSTVPWNGDTLRNGVYLIRHGETDFGT